MKKISIAPALLFLFATVPEIYAQQKAVEIKMATIAPAGSAWDKLVAQIVKEVSEQTKAKGAEVLVKVYPGGSQGDEKAVVAKIRSGQLQSGGLTGFGLGLIAPSVRVMELPFLFNNAAEVDAAIAKVGPQLQLALANGNPQVELLGWAEAGFVYILSNKPITKLADLKGVKMWMWEGDPVAEALYNDLGVVPIQLSIADVLTSLQTGMIEGVYAPPMGAVALQWASKVKYITDMPLVNSIGAFVVSKVAFHKLTSEQQKILKDVSTKYCRQIVEQTRKDNEVALASLQKLGVQKMPVTEEARQEIMKIAKGVGPKLVGKLFDQSLLSMVQTQ